MKKAFITGITGQDGSYLAELLLAKGYEVHGLVRRSSHAGANLVEHERLFLHYGDMSDSSGLWNLLYSIQPDEIYNLAAQSHVQVSFETPEYTGEVTALGALRLLEAIRGLGLKSRFYQASSSEMFGSSPAPQSESTPFYPRSPYACAKLFAHSITTNYRESYGMFAVSGILFNHESPRRGEMFVTRKIAKAVARIKVGLQETLALGNLDARRDWGHAPEYVVAMWKMLQREKPSDYVIGTGENHSVREFLDLAFGFVDLDWYRYLKIDSAFRRPAEVNDLRADPERARRELLWEPRTSFQWIVETMVQAELNQLKAAV